MDVASAFAAWAIARNEKNCSKNIRLVKKRRSAQPADPTQELRQQGLVVQRIFNFLLGLVLTRKANRMGGHCCCNQFTRFRKSDLNRSRRGGRTWSQWPKTKFHAHKKSANRTWWPSAETNIGQN